MTATELMTIDQAIELAVTGLASNVDRAFSTEDIYAIMERNTPEVFEQVLHAAVINRIRKWLKKATDSRGIPYALAVDNQGTYVQTAFAFPEEFEFAIKGYVRLAQANWAKGCLLADLCWEMHGHHIDIKQMAATVERTPLEAA